MVGNTAEPDRGYDLVRNGQQLEQESAEDGGKDLGGGRTGNSGWVYRPEHGCRI